MRSFDDPAKLSCVRWSPDGDVLATGSWEGSVQLRDAHSGKVTQQWRDVATVNAVAWSPDGSRLATVNAERVVRILRRSDGEVAAEFSLPAPKRPPESSSPARIGWSPNGRWIAQAIANTTARGLVVWDTCETENARPVFHAPAHATSTWSVAWSPDSSRIATGSSSGEIKIWLWNGAKAEELLAFDAHRWFVLGLGWDSSGERLLSADSSFEVRIWDGREEGDLDG